MIGIFLFYLFRSTRNRVISRVRRLKQPRYLLPALAGGAYLYFVLFRQVGGGRGASSSSPTPPPLEALPLFETAFAVLLLGLVVLPWLLPTQGRSTLFSDAEIQFLFPAPLTRRAVLNFRIFRMQTAILFGVLVFAVIFRRGLPVPSTMFLVVTLWIVYTFLALYRMGAFLSKLSLQQHGVPAVKRQIWMLLVLAVAGTSMVSWALWVAGAPELGGAMTPAGFIRWMDTTTRTGPALVVLFPFRALLQPAFAPDLAAFLIRLPMALAVLLFTYLWVVRSEAGFEEAAFEQAETTARGLQQAEAAPVRSPGRPKVRRAPFALAPAGNPVVAFFWKNLISAGRFQPRRLAGILLAVALSLAVTLGTQGRGKTAIASALAFGTAMIAGLLVVIGPTLVRDDLRLDLLQADVIKALPVTGWSVVLGEVLAPTAILSVLQWLLVGTALLLWPVAGRQGLDVPARLLIGLVVLFIVPGLNLAGVVVQNAFALLMPGWVQLGKRERRGIEASGQRMIAMGASAVMLGFGLLPAGMLFAIVYYAGHWVIGRLVIPLAGAAAGAVLVAEAAAGILLAGKMFEKLDVSVEQLSES